MRINVFLKAEGESDMENRDNVKEEEENKVFSYELLSDARDNNERWFKAFIAMVKVNVAELLAIVIVVLAFVWYLNQYDFTSSIEQNGVYTLIDSEGNVISSDITPEQINEIMEIINDGKNKDNTEQNKEKR